MKISPISLLPWYTFHSWDHSVKSQGSNKCDAQLLFYSSCSLPVKWVTCQTCLVVIHSETCQRLQTGPWEHVYRALIDCYNSLHVNYFAWLWMAKSSSHTYTWLQLKCGGLMCRCLKIRVPDVCPLLPLVCVRQATVAILLSLWDRVQDNVVHYIFCYNPQVFPKERGGRRRALAPNSTSGALSNVQN